MQITINDEVHRCEEGLCVAALLTCLGQDKPGVALALNQQILPRTEWTQQQLQAGDTLLLFQVIAGG